MFSLNCCAQPPRLQQAPCCSHGSQVGVIFTGTRSRRAVSTPYFHFPPKTITNLKLLPQGNFTGNLAVFFMASNLNKGRLLKACANLPHPFSRTTFTPFNSPSLLNYIISFRFFLFTSRTTTREPPQALDLRDLRELVAQRRGRFHIKRPSLSWGSRLYFFHV